jgi:hypothetical protein
MDFETYSAAGYEWAEPTAKYPLGRWEAPEGAKKPGIGAVGAPAYAEHPSTEVLTLSYDLCDGRGIRRWRPGQPNPQDLFDHVLTGGPIEAHNAMFERLICEHVCERKYGWPRFPATAWRCSMATALVAQRPAALAPLAQVLGLSEQKDKEGTRLINKFCVPQQPIVGLVDKKTGKIKRADQPARRIHPEDDPEDFEKLCTYCDQDVRTEMAAADAMPPMEPHEVIAWQFTQDMNYRGLGVDRAGLRACIAILKQVLAQYGRECEQITGLKVTQLEKMKEWLAGYGVHTTSLDADALAGLLDRDDLHPTARRVLELRERTGSASVKKTLAIEARCSADDRLRDIIVHHGTRPGRPSGEGPQPLNLPKAGPKLSWCDCGKPSAPAPSCPWCGEIKAPAARKAWQPEMVDQVLEVMGLGSLQMVEQFFGDAMVAIQGCVRGLFTAGPGNMLVSTDYSSLQAVVAACLAGEQWRIDAFRRGDPIYLLGASKITGRSMEEYLEYAQVHGAHHPDRQKIGKVSELACLGATTRVWTRSLGNRKRWKPIVNVLLTDRVWDGVRWVGHGGLVNRGEREVQVRAGIAATYDHQFLVGRTWRAFGEMTPDHWSRAVRPLDDLFAGHAGPLEPSPAGVQVVYDLADCGPRNRFLVASAYGPVLAHNCGFQGWINSYRAFGSDETDEVIRAQILAWRKASPAIVEAWGGQWRGPPWRRERQEMYGLEGMFVAAVQNPGQSFDYRGISFCMEDGDCLVIRLPQIDGIRRALRYHEPRLTPSARNADELSISYSTWNTNPNYGARGWVRMPTWGGRLFENVVMGVEVDIQRFGAKLLAAHGYPMVLGVYDEDVCEVPLDHPLTLQLPPVAGLDPHVQEIEHLLAIMPPEIADWPIKASGGWAHRRYRKG